LESVRKTADVLDGLLAQFHPDEDYTITVPLELLEKAEATKRIFNLVLGSIASISLVVGGIGIMNIMLATVTERTREIGILRALGARRRDITMQFLVETAVLSGIGGVLGVGLGLAVPRVVTKLSGMMTIVEPWAPIVAFVIAVLVGVGFGLYPARRAAMMDPVEALRSE
jgi:putative ABC transport system permease protein